LNEAKQVKQEERKQNVLSSFVPHVSEEPILSTDAGKNPHPQEKGKKRGKNI